MNDQTLSRSMAHAPASRLRSPRTALYAAAGLALVLIPFVLEDYYVFRLTTLLVTALGLLGLNLLYGFNGQFSLGQGAFYAIGAYTTAVAMLQFHIPYALTIPLAGLVSLLVGVLFGLPALRLPPLYLALATFALGAVTPQLLKYKRFEPWLGGAQGLSLSKPSAPWGLPLTADQWLYFFVLSFVLLGFLVAHNILGRHAGRAMMAVRDQPVAAAAMGIDVARVKTITFGISALYTGVAGALGTLCLQFVAPDMFLRISIELLMGLVVGGVGQLFGALYGAVFLSVVPAVTEHLSKSLTGVIYGGVLIACVYLLPHGIAGALGKLSRRVRASLGRRSHE